MYDYSFHKYSVEYEEKQYRKSIKFSRRNLPKILHIGNNPIIRYANSYYGLYSEKIIVDGVEIDAYGYVEDLANFDLDGVLSKVNSMGDPTFESLIIYGKANPIEDLSNKLVNIGPSPDNIIMLGYHTKDDVGVDRCVWIVINRTTYEVFNISNIDTSSHEFLEKYIKKYNPHFDNRNFALDFIKLVFKYHQISDIDFDCDSCTDSAVLDRYKPSGFRYPFHMNDGVIINKVSYGCAKFSVDAFDKYDCIMNGKPRSLFIRVFDCTYVWDTITVKKLVDLIDLDLEDCCRIEVSKFNLDYDSKKVSKNELNMYNHIIGKRMINRYCGLLKWKELLIDELDSLLAKYSA